MCSCATEPEMFLQAKKAQNCCFNVTVTSQIYTEYIVKEARKDSMVFTMAFAFRCKSEAKFSLVDFE